VRGRSAIILGQVGKNRAYSVLYSANLCIRRRFGTMSRAGVPGAAERCGRALPEEQKALPAGGRSRPLRRGARCGRDPKRALATRHPRAAARASGAPRVAVLSFWTTARPTSDSRPAGWRPLRDWLAPEALGAGWLAADGGAAWSLVANTHQHTHPSSRNSHNDFIHRSRKDG